MSKFYNPKTGVLSISALVEAACANPDKYAVEVTEVNDYIDLLKKNQLGDALTAVRAVKATLESLDVLFKDQLLRKTNRSFETELSRIDITHSEQERLDVKKIRVDMGRKWVSKYTKTTPTTTVVALTHERWKAMQKKKSKAMKKVNKTRVRLLAGPSSATQRRLTNE